jgi:hypothetical protein
MRKFLLSAIAAAALTVPAGASIIVSETTTPGPGSGQTTFGYTANLTDDEAANAGTTMFTIYDLAGIVSVTAPSGWSWTEQAVGVTPANVAPPDNPAIMNVTYTYTGATLAGPASFTGFNVVSNATGTANGWFSDQATKNTGPLTGNLDQTVGRVLVPASGVPEPGTLLLLGCGLAAGRLPHLFLDRELLLELSRQRQFVASFHRGFHLLPEFRAEPAGR